MTRLLGLAAFGVIGIPLLAQDAAAPEAANKKLIDKALSQSYLQGKITAIDLEKKTFTLQAIVESKKVLNKENAQRYAKLQADLRRVRSKQEYDQLLPQVKAAAEAQYEVKETTHDFKIQGNDTFQVRVDRLAPREGPDGKVKPYTAQELAKLKGPGGLPGYTIDPRELDTSATVRAYLVREAKTKAPAKEEPAKLTVKTAGSAEKPKEEMAADTHPVSVILILRPDTNVPQGTAAPPPAGVNPFIVK